MTDSAGIATPVKRSVSRLKFSDERYDVLRTLGMGGVGMVFLAREKATNKLFALKVLRPSLRKHQEVITRFKREVEIAQKISHPNVAGVFSFNENENHLFIKMEFIDGMELGQYNRTENPSLEMKLAIMKGICAAVDAAHAAGVIHRDLKPANILIAKDGSPHVLDFGVASLSDEGTVTRPGAFIGTPLYVSPEQAQGKKADKPADIYSLGAIFYELMTGRPPFIGDSPVTIALMHVRETPFKPRSLNADIPPLIEDVILHCLEKDPSSRPKTASMIVREIEKPIEAELRTARTAARAMAQEPGSGKLSDVSLFQYLRVVAPIRRNFVLEIVNNQEFGRYHFRNGHLIHGEAGNLRDQEVAYNLFYWTDGIFRLVENADAPAKETVSIPWIPFVEEYFARLNRLMLGCHRVIPGPVIVDLLDPKGSTVYRYSSDERFEAKLGDRAKMSLKAFQGGRSHLRSKGVLKVAKVGEAEASQLFCFFRGLRHYLFVTAEAGADVEALYLWFKNELEQQMIEELHDSMVEADTKREHRKGLVKVLMIENEDFLGNLIRIKLRALGMDVYRMRDGVKAVEVSTQFRPDVIVLSMGIPGMNGFDVCQALAADPNLAGIPILLLVTAQREALTKELWPPGVVKVLSKPIVLSELVEDVQRYASRGVRRTATVR